MPALRKEYTCVEAGTGRRYKKVPDPCARHTQRRNRHDVARDAAAAGQTLAIHARSPRSRWTHAARYIGRQRATPAARFIWTLVRAYPCKTCGTTIGDGQNQNAKITGYPTEKNCGTCSNVIIEASSQSGDLVLDCFAGSGTTLVEAGAVGAAVDRRGQQSACARNDTPPLRARHTTDGRLRAETLRLMTAR